MIVIDGARGEGGGQILRSALALSVLTGRAVRIEGIRARRSRPGLQPQHLQAVQAAAAVGAAAVSGATAGAHTLAFEPRATCAGTYHFDIGTAGATTLVLQTVALPLSFAAAPSQLRIDGGTHVPWSPSYHHVAYLWCHYLRAAGYSIELVLDRAGFYPRGGGRIRAEIRPATPRPLLLTERGALRGITGIAAVARLDVSIAERMRRRALGGLRPAKTNIEIAVERLDARSPGAFLLLSAEYEYGRWCHCALGARGRPSEAVADEAVQALRRFEATSAAVERHLADQLLLPLALAPGRSRLAVAEITAHLVTNAELIGRFLPVRIVIEGSAGAPGVVHIEGVDLKQATGGGQRETGFPPSPPERGRGI